ncbi:MAG: ATP-binding protein, partial [Thermoanaerobaculia bacterium]
MLLLRFLARSIHETRLLVVGAFREVEAGIDASVKQTLDDFSAEPNCRVLHLSGLTVPDTERLVSATLGGPAPHAFVVALHGRTGGNPLFTIEILRLLARSSAKGVGVEFWKGLDPAKVELPPEVRAVIRQRLDLLSLRCRRTLVQASVVGFDFSLSLLEKVCDRERADLLNDLREAVHRHVLGGDPEMPGAYRFAHPLIHQVVYEELGEADLVALHRRVGEALEEIHADHLAPILDELASHFYRASRTGDVEKAVDYAGRTAESAFAVSAWERSAFHLRRALELLDRKGEKQDTRRCGLLLGLGEAQKALGDTEGSRETILEAARIARDLGRPDDLARAALSIGRAFLSFVAGEVDELQIRLLEEALSATRPEGPSSRAMLLARLTHAIYWSGDVARCMRLGEEAVDSARSAGHTYDLTYALCAKYVSRLRSEITESQIPLVDEMTRLADETGERAIRLNCHLWRIGELLRFGRRNALHAEIVLVKKLAAELRIPSALARAAVVEALPALIQGRLEEVEGLIQRYLSLAQGANDPLILQCFGLH